MTRNLERGSIVMSSADNHSRYRLLRGAVLHNVAVNISFVTPTLVL